MNHIFKSYKLYFVLILAAAFISFNGGYDPKTNDAPSLPDFSVNDIDNIESLQFSASTNQVIVTPFISSGHSRVTADELLKGFGGTFSHFNAADTITLTANPGPANNGLSAVGAGMLFNLIGGPRDVFVTRIKTALSLPASAPVRFEVYIRPGNALGGPVGSGPGSSLAGWTLIDTADGFQGPVANGISEMIQFGPIPVGAGDTVGVAIKFTLGGPRYFGTGSPPLENYVDTNIRLITGDSRSAVFTTTGTFFSSRALTGELGYIVATPTGIINNEIPVGFRLEQNYPNPFNPSTTIEFSLPSKSNVTLKIYNVHGQEVAALINGEYSAGIHSINWNASGFASGIYFYSLQSGSFSETKKLILIK